MVFYILKILCDLDPNQEGRTSNKTITSVTFASSKILLINVELPRPQKLLMIGSTFWGCAALDYNTLAIQIEWGDICCFSLLWQEKTRPKQKLLLVFENQRSSSDQVICHSVKTNFYDANLLCLKSWWL